MAKIKVTLVKSVIGQKPNIKLNAASLGLKRPGDAIVAEKIPANEGKIRKIIHLVKVEDVD